MQILAVNQVSKNFDNGMNKINLLVIASLLDLSFAFSISARSNDQVFRHKFAKKVTAKISLIDIANTPTLSLRCILSIMSNLQQSTYVGQE